LALSADVDALEEGVAGNSRYLAFIDRGSFGCLLEQLLGETRGGKLRYQSGAEAAMMMQVTMMTGVRPNEWPSCRFLDSFFDPDTKLTLGPVLEIQTLKQSGRRDDNPLRDKRYLVLDRWPSEQVEQLKSFVGLVHGLGDEFGSFYGKARMALSRAWKRAQVEYRRQCERVLTEFRSQADGHLRVPDDRRVEGEETCVIEESLRAREEGLGGGEVFEGADGVCVDVLSELAESWVSAASMGAVSVEVVSDLDRLSGLVALRDERGISFYTGRHIFAEEIRRSISLTRFELAALLGHSLLTNQVYYGPRQGTLTREYDFELPRPWPGDADDIKQWDYKVNPLRTAYMQGDLFGGMALDGTDTVSKERLELDHGSDAYFRR